MGTTRVTQNIGYTRRCQGTVLPDPGSIPGASTAVLFAAKTFLGPPVYGHVHVAGPKTFWRRKILAVARLGSVRWGTWGTWGSLLWSCAPWGLGARSSGAALHGDGGLAPLERRSMGTGLAPLDRRRCRRHRRSRSRPCQTRAECARQKGSRPPASGTTDANLRTNSVSAAKARQLPLTPTV